MSETGVSAISPDCYHNFLMASTRALQVNCILPSTGPVRTGLPRIRKSEFFAVSIKFLKTELQRLFCTALL